MNTQIAKLHAIAGKRSRRIIGLMSGTSLDGLDIALCHIADSGRSTSVTVEKFTTIPYNPTFRDAIRAVFAKRHIDQQQLSGLNALIGTTHADLINRALLEWRIPNGEIDVIASHGQTVYHAPQSLTGDPSLPNSTLQIGDADHIAVRTGIVTVADFRQKHIAAGGEGAPLAVYGDHLLFTHDSETRVLLNIGGIANFTFLPPAGSEQARFATDVGPGNTLINQYMLHHLRKEMDLDGAVAASGTVEESLLRALLDHPFFDLAFPKTTGPELFSLAYLERKQAETNTTALNPATIVATLTAFSAHAIAGAILNAAGQHQDVHVYISGGGLHNPVLIAAIKRLLPGFFVSAFDVLGVLPDAKEAALFAVLANETIAGKPSNVAGIRDSPAVCMGKISLPE